MLSLADSEATEIRIKRGLRGGAQGRARQSIAPKPQRVAHAQEVERPKAAVEMRDREIDWLKTKRAEVGSLFDIAKTKPDKIARIVLENVGLADPRHPQRADIDD